MASFDFQMAGARVPGVRAVALDPTRVDAAMAAAKRNGADDVFFRVGQDTFVASARHMPLDGLRGGATIAVQGRMATVVRVDDESSRWGEFGLMGLGAGAGVGLVASLALGAGAIPVGLAALGAALGAGVGWLFSKLTKAEAPTTDIMKGVIASGVSLGMATLMKLGANRALLLTFGLQVAGAVAGVAWSFLRPAETERLAAYGRPIQRLG